MSGWSARCKRQDAVIGEVDLDSVVAFLRRPVAYPEVPGEVVVVQTHMSWVFLTGTHAYKLKKRVRLNGVDLGTPARRRENCEEEVNLNRRLAPDVYLGVVALTLEPDGRLSLGGSGEPVDWLVRMRRLSANDMLDAVIAGGRTMAEEPSIRAAARHLARFYATAPPEPLSALAHCSLLADGVRRDVQTLSSARYGLPVQRLESLARAELAYLERCYSVFEHRILTDRIVDGHGDLRPEHVCLRPAPAIIDCLEFAKELRIVDPADELAFLALECDRLGDARAGQWFQETYSHVTDDEPPESLIHFYRVYRALRRARIAAAHLDDPSVPNPKTFADRARQYLDMVEPVAIG